MRRSAPPNAKFTACSGQRTIPRRLPSGANTQMPPGPVQYTRPMLSTFSPSGIPGSVPSFISAKIHRATNCPSIEFEGMDVFRRAGICHIHRAFIERQGETIGVFAVREHAQAAIGCQSVHAGTIPEVVFAGGAGNFALPIGAAL